MIFKFELVFIEHEFQDNEVYFIAQEHLPLAFESLFDDSIHLRVIIEPLKIWK